MNWIKMTIVSIIIMVLVVLIINRNQKDKRGFISKLNNDYKKTKNEEDED